MYCRNCGQYIPDDAKVCTNCATPTDAAPNSAPKEKVCQNCGASVNPNAVICVKCGCSVNGGNPEAKSRLVAALLALFLGGFGIHRFYLGYTSIGVAQILVSVVTCGFGGIWGFIEGILILCNTTITTDANGVPLKD